MLPRTRPRREQHDAHAAGSLDARARPSLALPYRPCYSGSARSATVERIELDSRVAELGASLGEPLGALEVGVRDAREVGAREDGVLEVGSGTEAIRTSASARANRGPLARYSRVPPGAAASVH
jgi:hypothetical protein